MGFRDSARNLAIPATPFPVMETAFGRLPKEGQAVFRHQLCGNHYDGDGVAEQASRAMRPVAQATQTKPTRAK